MSLTRRRFIEAASLTLLAGAACPIARAQSLSASDQGTFSAEDVAVLDGVSEETFHALIGERFAVLQANRRLEYMTLLSVASPAAPNLESRLPRAGAPSRPPGQAIHSFSLRFQTTGNSLGQGTYTFTNESLGSFPLFIVPGGPGMNPKSYTATFSLLAP
jgi:hypothetical protein